VDGRHIGTRVGPGCLWQRIPSPVAVWHSVRHK